MATREQDSQLLAALNKAVGKSWSEVRKAAPQTSERLLLPEAEYPMQCSKLIGSVDKKEKFPIFYVRLVVMGPDDVKGKVGLKSYRIRGNDYGTEADYMGRFVADMKVAYPDLPWETAELKDVPGLIAKANETKPVLRVFAKEPKNPQYGSDLYINGRVEGDDLEQLLGGDETPHEEGEPEEPEQPETPEDTGPEEDGGEFIPAIGEKYKYPRGKGGKLHEVKAVNEGEQTCTLAIRDPKTKKTVNVPGVAFSDLGDYVE